MESFSLFDVVALIEDKPDRKLIKGQVGTIVEQLDNNTFEVEFCDNEGNTYALEPIHSKSLLLLNYHAVAI